MRSRCRGVEVGYNTVSATQSSSRPTRIMREVVGAVDARALGEQIGHLTLDEMRSVDEALPLVLGLR